MSFLLDCYTQNLSNLTFLENNNSESWVIGIYYVSMQDKKWMNYISLYSQLIKKVIRGGPHRVVIICMLWAHCLDGIFAWLNIAWKASFGGTHLYCLSVIPLVSNYPYQVCLIYWKWRVSLWLPNKNIWPKSIVFTFVNY